MVKNVHIKYTIPNGKIHWILRKRKKIRGQFLSVDFVRKAYAAKGVKHNVASQISTTTVHLAHRKYSNLSTHWKSDSCTLGLAIADLNGRTAKPLL